MILIVRARARIVYTPTGPRIIIPVIRVGVAAVVIISRLVRVRQAIQADLQ